MGVFDLLFGRKKQTNVECVPDRIWMSTDAKFVGLAKEVAERSESRTVAILLAAHFPDVLERLEKIASQLGSAVPVKAVMASDLNTELAANLDLGEADVLDVIVGERHPLPSVDDRLEEFANELPCRCRFSHHISLDDAVIKIFAGEQVRKMLSKLGMQESEAIESRMVSARIRNAQQKIEGIAAKNAGAVSADEWLEKNCPELLSR